VPQRAPIPGCWALPWRPGSPAVFFSSPFLSLKPRSTAPPQKKPSSCPSGRTAALRAWAPPSIQDPCSPRPRPPDQPPAPPPPQPPYLPPPCPPPVFLPPNHGPACLRDRPVFMPWMGPFRRGGWGGGGAHRGPPFFFTPWPTNVTGKKKSPNHRPLKLESNFVTGPVFSPDRSPPVPPPLCWSPVFSDKTTVPGKYAVFLFSASRNSGPCSLVYVQKSCPTTPPPRGFPPPHAPHLGQGFPWLVKPWGLAFVFGHTPKNCFRRKFHPPPSPERPPPPPGV